VRGGCWPRSILLTTKKKQNKGGLTRVLRLRKYPPQFISHATHVRQKMAQNIKSISTKPS
jgi:hypothetical protein